MNENNNKVYETNKDINKNNNNNVNENNNNNISNERAIINMNGSNYNKNKPNCY